MINLLLVLFVAFAAPMPPLNINYDRNVTATKLYQDYKNDKAKADQLYLDKRLFLHGIVKERSLNLWTVYLVIPGPGDGITARIDDYSLTKVPLYNPGDKFDLVCVGAGIVFDLPIVLNCKPLN